MTTLQDIRNQLIKMLGGEARLGVDGDQQIFGLVVSRAFEGDTPRVREQRLWGALYRRFSEKELKRVILLLPITPAEERSIS